MSSRPDESTLEVGLDFEAGHNGRMHLILELFESVLPPLLGRVHRQVGVA